MIESLSIENFKIFAQTGKIPIKPLTVIVGKNSSGKSSAIQAMLLLQQSMLERAIANPLPQLVLNGSRYEAGTYRDVIHNHEEERNLVFSFDVSIAPNQSMARRESLVALKVAPVYRQRFPMYWYRDASSDLPPGSAASIQLCFRFEEPFGPTLDTISVHIDNIGTTQFSAKAPSDGPPKLTVVESTIPWKNKELEFFSSGLLPHLDYYSATRSSKSPAKDVTRFIYTMSRALYEVGDFFAHLQFLGPFRQSPQRQYLFSGFSATDAGDKGERAVDLLVTEHILAGNKAGHLQKAVSYWMKRLDLAGDLRIRSLAKQANLFEVRVRNAGYQTLANFADVGFGISQVLPVIIQGLITPVGGTFVVQQPELHLHPDAQAELADFFFYLASNGIKCIVETHSEYFLIRLRRRLAEKYSPPKIGIERKHVELSIDRDEVSVIYPSEASEDGSGAVFKQLKIDESFQFENLPDGFMNQSVEERLGLLKALRGK